MSTKRIYLEYCLYCISLSYHMVQDDVLESTDCNTFEEIQAPVPVKEYLSVRCICFEQGVP